MLNQARITTLHKGMAEPTKIKRVELAHKAYKKYLKTLKKLELELDITKLKMLETLTKQSPGTDDFKAEFLKLF